MSFGSLSANAVLALNTGAHLGGFAHDTGEGGLSEYHLRPGGDLVWEIGTGYFGCRTDDGGFDERQFAGRQAGHRRRPARRQGTSTTRPAPPTWPESWPTIRSASSSTRRP